MNANQYQTAARKTAQYPQDASIIYPALGLMSELGELSGVVKRIVTKSYADIADAYAKVHEETGDILWYLAALLSDINTTMPPNDLNSFADKIDASSIFDSLSSITISLAAEIAYIISNVDEMIYFQRPVYADQHWVSTVLNHLGRICLATGTTLNDVAQTNLDKLSKRASKGTVLTVNRSE